MAKFARKQDIVEPTIEQANLESDLEVSDTMLEANVCKPAGTQELTTNEWYDHLSTNQKVSITTLLTKHKESFQGKRGKWKGGYVTLRLKQDAKPHLAKPRPVPLPQKDELKKELDQQCE